MIEVYKSSNEEEEGKHTKKNGNQKSKVNTCGIKLAAPFVKRI